MNEKSVSEKPVMRLGATIPRASNPPPFEIGDYLLTPTTVNIYRCEPRDDEDQDSSDSAESHPLRNWTVARVVKRDDYNAFAQVDRLFRDSDPRWVDIPPDHMGNISYRMISRVFKTELEASEVAASLTIMINKSRVIIDTLTQMQARYLRALRSENDELLCDNLINEFSHYLDETRPSFQKLGSKLQLLLSDT